MVTFSPDGTKVLVANEGEPDEHTSVDPKGSVSIVSLPFDGSTTTIVVDGVSLAEVFGAGHRSAFFARRLIEVGIVTPVKIPRVRTFLEFGPCDLLFAQWRVKSVKGHERVRIVRLLIIMRHVYAKIDAACLLTCGASTSMKA